MKTFYTIDYSYDSKSGQYEPRFFGRTLNKNGLFVKEEPSLASSFGEKPIKKHSSLLTFHKMGKPLNATRLIVCRSSNQDLPNENENEIKANNSAFTESPNLLHYGFPLCGNPQYLEDFDNEFNSPIHGKSLDHPQLGKIEIFDEGHSYSTSGPSYLNMFVNKGLTLYSQKLVPDPIKPNNVRKILNRGALTTDALVKRMQYDPCILAALNLKGTEEVVVVDLDARQNGPTKPFLWHFVCWVFAYNGYGKGTQYGPLTIETPRGFHLWFKKPSSFKVPTARSQLCRFGFNVELISKGTLAIGGLQRYILFDQQLDNLPELPELFKPVHFNNLKNTWESITKIIPIGQRFLTLQNMIQVGLLNDRNIFDFVYSTMIEGQLEPSEYEYLSARAETLGNKEQLKEINQIETIPSLNSIIPESKEFEMDLTLINQKFQGQPNLIEAYETALKLYNLALEQEIKPVAAHFIKTYGNEMGLTKFIALYYYAINRFLIYSYELQEFLFYNEIKGIWETPSEGTPISIFQRLLYSLNQGSLLNRPLLTRVGENLKTYIGLNNLPAVRGIATRSGFLSFESGRLEKNSPFNYATRFLNYNVYNTSEISPLIKEWFYNLANNKSHSLLDIRMCLHMCITGLKELHLGHYIVGEPGSGKGTFIWLIKQLLGPDNVFAITNLTQDSSFVLQGLGTKQLIVYEDFNGDFIAKNFSDLLRNALGGDDVLVPVKLSPKTAVRRGGINILISGNAPVPWGYETEALSRRLVYIETGGTKSKFAETDLRAQLAANLPAIMRWAINCPMEYFFCAQEAVVISALNLNPSWCSVTAFVFRNADNILIGSDLTSPLNRQQDSPETPIYQAYLKFCRETGVFPKTIIAENRFYSIFSIAMERLVKRKPSRKEARSGTLVIGLKYYPVNPPSLPNTEKACPRLSLQTAVIKLLDPFENQLIPLYKLPRHLYKMLWLLKQAGCPGKLNALQQGKKFATISLEMSGDELPNGRPALAESFWDAVKNCPSIVDVSITSARQVPSLFSAQNSDLPESPDLPSLDAKKNPEKVAAMKEIAENALEVPFHTFQQLLEEKLSFKQIEEFRALYDSPFVEWQEFFERMDVKRDNLYVLGPAQKDLEFSISDLTNKNNQDFPVNSSDDLSKENGKVSSLTGVIETSLETENKSVNVGISGVKDSGEVVIANLANERNAPLETSKPLKKGDKETFMANISSKIFPLTLEKSFPFSPHISIPATWKGLIKYKKTGAMVQPRPISPEARLLHQSLNLICEHIINNTKLTKMPRVINDVKIALPLKKALDKIIAALDSQALIEWGTNINITPACIGLAFVVEHPTDFTAYLPQLECVDIIEGYIPILARPKNATELSDMLSKCRQHHKDLINLLNSGDWFVERPRDYDYSQKNLYAEAWLRLRQLLANSYSTNPLTSYLNTKIGPTLQIGFDLACLMVGLTEQLKKGEKVLTGTNKFFGKRSYVGEPFATQYELNPNDPGRLTVKGTTYLTFPVDFRKVLLRCVRATNAFGDYVISSIDIKGCHLGIALGILGQEKAPILWDVFTSKGDMWSPKYLKAYTDEPIRKKDLKKVFYAILNGGKSDLEGIARHLKDSREESNEEIRGEEIRKTAQDLAKHPYLQELQCFQQWAKARGNSFYLPTDPNPIAKFSTRINEEMNGEESVKSFSSAPYKNASPIFTTFEFLFISRLIYEVYALCASGKDIYMLQGMHDGFLILHHKNDDCSWLIDHLNEILIRYSAECLDLELTASLKPEG